MLLLSLELKNFFLQKRCLLIKLPIHRVMPIEFDRIEKWIVMVVAPLPLPIWAAAVHRPPWWKSRLLEIILNPTAPSRATQSAGQAVGRVAQSPNMAFVLPREIIHKPNRTDGRTGARGGGGGGGGGGILVSFCFYCFSFRRACAIAATSSADLRASAEVSLKEHSSSCAQSNTRPQSERKKYVHRSYSVFRYFSPLTVHL